MFTYVIVTAILVILLIIAYCWATLYKNPDKESIYYKPRKK